MLLNPSAPVLGRPTLPPLQRRPAKEIYAGYSRFLDEKPARGGPSFNAVVEERFGIPDWEWARLKLVYEDHLEGNDYATGLVDDIDAGTKTISGAYRLLKEQAADDDLAAAMPTIRLNDVLGRVHASQTYYRTVTAAVRAESRINRGGMTDADVIELTHLLRAHGASLTRLARLLGATITGGTDGHSRQGRR